MSTRRCLLLLLAGAVFSCRQVPKEEPQPAAVPPPTAETPSLDDLVRRTDALEHRVHRLSAQWADVEAEYDSARKDFDDAGQRYRAAGRDSAKASGQFRAAAEEWESAKVRWEYFQKLVVIAAAIDAANIEQFRAASGAKYAESTSCSDGMSTRAYRRRLEGRGVDLTGKDIDHIVPHSLGGADHPANYQVISSSLNRSLQDTWNSAKCQGVGLGLCAAAVLVSRRCGEFKGPLF